MSKPLDKHQLKAVKHFEGPALVVAGPGSGKTAVIKERIVNLIREQNVNPQKILAIAFTNTAVDEMKTRLRSESVLPKICTLHVFGKEIITNEYVQANFTQKPENIWDDKKISRIIEKEKDRFERILRNVSVAIYKIEGLNTGRCYIGQTTNPERRKQEHFTYSSNQGLREAIQQGNETFKFKKIEWVKGANAYSREKYWIDHYRNKSIIFLESHTEEIENKIDDPSLLVYKIKSRREAQCWIGMSNDLELSLDVHLKNTSDDELRSEINSGNFEIISGKLTRNEAVRFILIEMQKHKDQAVFNRSDPEKAQISNKLRIEMFCKHYKVAYEEVLEQPEKFHNLMDKFDVMKDSILDVKGQVDSGLFDPNEIPDIILRAFAVKYEEIKQKADAIDFFDMLIISAHTLENDPDLLSKYREKFHYVLVDEFQDISPADFRLIKLFQRNLFAVGDDDQAIYGFRGGNSEIMLDFGDREDVKEYNVTRNYRSTETIVRHTKALIEHNSHRRDKNLYAENSAHSRVEVVKTSRDTVEKALLNELLPIVTVCETHFNENTPYLGNSLLQELTTPQEIGILARNWYEVNPIKSYLNATLINKGFQVCWSDSDDLEKRKQFMQRGQKRIEISTIHSAKGQEWDKVIILANTMSHGINPKPSLPDGRNNLSDERKLFYVAVTRAKHELVIFDGGNCPFVAEFQELPHSERKLQLQKIQSILLSVFRIRLTDAKEQLCNVSETLHAAFDLQRERLVAESVKTLHKQYETELEPRRNSINETNSLSKKIKTALPQQLKKSRETFLPELIPVLDQLELVIKDVTETIETNNLSNEFTKFYDNIHSAQDQFLDFLKNHGLRRIETVGKGYSSNRHVSIRSSYSNEVPKGIIIEEFSPGYLIDGKVVSKAQVIVSQGLKPLTTKRSTKSILTQDYSQSVIVITYKGCFYLKSIQLLFHKIKGIDRRGLAINCKIEEVLFLLPNKYWTEVKPYLFMNSSVRNQNLHPSKQGLETHLKYDTLLRDVYVVTNSKENNRQSSILQITTRAGYVLQGSLLDYDRKVLHICMGGKTVIVYWHGVLEIRLKSKIQEIVEDNSTDVHTDSLPTVASKRSTHTYDSDDSNLELDTETHSQILREQIQKLDITSEHISSKTEEIKTATNEVHEDQKIENDISKEKQAPSPTTQEVNKNLGHYLRQIYNFVKGIRN